MTPSALRTDRLRQSYRHCRGLTLTELLVVLALAGIVLASAVPNLSGFLQRQRLVASANDFLHALKLARAEAMQRDVPVIVAPQDGHDWNSGWQVFAKAGSSTHPAFQQGDWLLYRTPPPSPGISIVTNLGAPHIAYNGSGRARSGAGGHPGFLGTLKFSAQEDARMIRIARLGRARLCDPALDRSCSFAETANSAGNSAANSAP
ncbi:GspH/FimT family pseudopilin [Herbaspirillum sp. RTI4]|nr:GspH/FimT family pseudopilin [Herbaspirillum sp. RTI4]MEA9982589.1 GspH/FimT family pseudopilin [Herbaspirillum sp. RTI4]